MVFNPITDELFTAVRGRGAFLNEATRLAVSEEDDPGSALLITEVGVGRDAATVEAVFDRMAKLAGAVRAIRVRGHDTSAPVRTERKPERGLRQRGTAVWRLLWAHCWTSNVTEAEDAAVGHLKVQGR